MIKEFDGQWWYCCPRCGKKLHPLQAGAVCRGVLARCRGIRRDGSRCGWAGEITIDWEPEKMRPIPPA